MQSQKITAWAEERTRVNLAIQQIEFWAFQIQEDNHPELLTCSAELATIANRLRAWESRQVSYQAPPGYIHSSSDNCKTDTLTSAN